MRGVLRPAANAALSLLLLTGDPLSHDSLGRPLLPGWAAPQAALAAKDFTDEQRLAAEAWTKADKEFADRTFAGQDWFKRRQSMTKKNYASREEAYEEIREMLKSLDDKYTRFLTPAMYNAVYSVATGDVAGIGVELALTPIDSGSAEEQVGISTVVEGAPSDLAGLKPGDILLDADGSSLLGLSPEEAAAKVRGPKGSKLRLTIRRSGEAEPLVKIITRAAVKLAGTLSERDIELAYRCM